MKSAGCGRSGDRDGGGRTKKATTKTTGARQRERRGSSAGTSVCGAKNQADLADLWIQHGKGRGRGARARARPAAPATAAAAAAATYDPREYQPPHPDDRGGKTTKKKGGGATAKGKGEGGGEGSAKGAEGDGTHRCGNCDALDAKSKCKGCGVEYYCNRECQTVGLGRR